MVTCPVCHRTYRQLTLTHLKHHGLNRWRFEQRFPRHDRGYTGTHHPQFGMPLSSVARRRISQAMRGNHNGVKRRGRQRTHHVTTPFDDATWRHRISVAMRGKTPWNRLADRALLKRLLELARALGKVPTQRDMNHARGYPDRKAYVRAFGSWKHAVTLAGLQPPHRYGVIGSAADGHRCRSYPEILIDDWLTQHGIAHAKDQRYPTGVHTVDWVIGGTFVEYFGIEHNRRYRQTIEHKRSICHQLGIRLIELYPTDLGRLAAALGSFIDGGDADCYTASRGVEQPGSSQGLRSLGPPNWTTVGHNNPSKSVNPRH